jgi:hypothetical protein
MSVWTINETISAIDRKPRHTSQKITREEANQIISTILRRTKNISEPYYYLTSHFTLLLLLSIDLVACYYVMINAISNHKKRK